MKTNMGTENKPVTARGQGSGAGWTRGRKGQVRVVQRAWDRIRDT